MPVDAFSHMDMIIISGIGVRLEFHHMMKFQKDSFLECRGMITRRVM